MMRDENFTRLPKLYTKDEVMSYLDISEATLKRHVASGRLGHIKLGPHRASPWRCREDQLMKYIGL
jgi:excisionase family DNA binding protein